MKYILMCGGDYKDRFEIPKQLLKVNGEVLVERTIRLLRENGIKDIAISTSNPLFNNLGVEILHSKKNYIHDDKERHKKSEKSWLNAYYPIEEPACYIHGDVYFSEEAIKTIVNTKVKDTMFFCTRDLDDGRPMGINIKGREPLAYKVENQKIFRQAINDLFKMIDDGKFNFDPISWNLYRQINGLELDYNWYGSGIFKSKGDYIVIDDYTTDVDAMKDILSIERLFRIIKGEEKMVRVKVIEDFHLGNFSEIRNIIRKDRNKNGYLFVDDIFECSEDLAKYLLNEKRNPGDRAFIKVLEVIPEEKKEIKKTTRKTTTRKPRIKKTTTKGDEA